MVSFQIRSEAMWKLLLFQSSLLWLVRIAPADTGGEQCQYGIIETLEGRLDDMHDFFQIMVEEFRRLQLMSDYQNIIQFGSGVSRIRSSGVMANHPFMEAGVVDLHSVLRIHDHAEFYKHMGMGKFTGLMGGTYFETRHNDYTLMMKSTTKKGYRELEEVHFPPVPPSVASKATVAEQVAEMKAYFQAFKAQNTSIRPYEDFFKALMIYVETAWFDFPQDTITEPFDSARHRLRANSFKELTGKVEFNMHTGHKDQGEDLAWLQTRLYGMDENNQPKYAQFFYRILAHPIRRKFKTSYLKVLDDTGIKVKLTKEYGVSAVENIADKRQARFEVVRKASGTEDNEMDRSMTLMDHIFREIPGLSNLGNCLDSIEGVTAFEERNDGLLHQMNACRYHRAYRTARATADGNNHVPKTFNSDYAYKAMNTEEDVVPSVFKTCKSNGQCTEYTQRWSDAIPLEIVYTTPLMYWNPYDIEYQGEHKTPEGDRIYDGCVDENTGESKPCDGKTEKTAFNGCNSGNYYFCPAELFDSENVEPDAADTTPNGVVYVKDKSGTPHKMKASGIRIQYPMHNLGKIRGRWPIFQVAEEKTFTFMQLKAVEEIVQQPAEMMHLINTTDTPWECDSGCVEPLNP